MRPAFPSCIIVKRRRCRGRRSGGPLFALAGTLALLAAFALRTPGAATATAHAARSYSLSETGHLHRTSGRGITINQVLNEEGSASGTVSGSIYIHLKVVSVDRINAEVNIYPSGGSISATANATYRSAGAVASFTGTMSILRGSGRYAHAHGSSLTFTGTVQRINDAVTVHVTGRMYT